MLSFFQLSLFCLDKEVLKRRTKFIFTAGMTLVDSIDSVLVLYSYSGFPERGWAFFTTKTADVVIEEKAPGQAEKGAHGVVAEAAERETRVKLNVMSTLSIILTLLSILLAFRFVVLRNLKILMSHGKQYFLDHHHEFDRRAMYPLRSGCGSRGWWWTCRVMVEGLGQG